jgi:hypothetical protein
MNPPFVPSDIVAECRNLRRPGDVLAIVASRLGFGPDELRIKLREPEWKKIPSEPEVTSIDDSKPGPKARHA